MNEESKQHESSPPPISDAAEPPAAGEPVDPFSQDEASSIPADPWAHRRGEPRVFAFLWTLYLLAAVIGSVMWLAGTASLQPDAYGPAARIMLVAIAAGITILWPMARLCQEPPERPLRACFADAVVVISPVQMVVWSLALLAGWPLDVIAATAALLTVWGGLAGGFLANALLDHRLAAVSGLTRTGWMIGLIAVVFLGQLLAAFGVATDRPWLADLSGLSPFAGVYEISGHGIRGAERAVTPWQWWLIGTVGVASALVWLAAGLRAAWPGPAETSGQ